MSPETLFICYAREDTAFALRVADDLASAGMSVWIDQRNISPGQRWDEAIERALSDSSRLLLILSPDAVRSAAVMDELAYALNENKPIVPILHRECKSPLRLSRLHYIDFSRSYETGITTLVQAHVGAAGGTKIDNAANDESAVRPEYSGQSQPLAESKDYVGSFVVIGAIAGCVGAVWMCFIKQDMHGAIAGLLVAGAMLISAFLAASAGFFASQRRVNLVSAIVVAVATLALLTYFAGSFGTAIALMGITQAASLAAAAFCQTLLPPST